MGTERVTVTLPTDLVEGIDRVEGNRSRFIAEAVERELVRRRREGLFRSLASPHPDIPSLAEVGVSEWGAALPAEDDPLVNEDAGQRVRWIEGQGWVEEQV